MFFTNPGTPPSLSGAGAGRFSTTPSSSRKTVPSPALAANAPISAAADLRALSSRLSLLDCSGQSALARSCRKTLPASALRSSDTSGLCLSRSACISGPGAKFI